MPSPAHCSPRIDRLRRRALWLAVPLALCCGGSALAAPAAKPAKVKKVRPVPAAPANLATLLGHFRELPGFTASFVELKRMALLAAPLKSQGTLAYSPPGLLARAILKPAPTVVIVEPSRVRSFDGSRWRVIDFKTHPVVRRFVQSFVILLQGDLAGLQKRYTTTYNLVRDAKGVAIGWHIKLVPRKAPLNKVVRLLETRGSGLKVASLRMVEVDGDETLTTFSAVDAGRRFSARDRARIFHLERK